ncbi:MAG: N-acetylmuramoyl-L-alanine amidase [Leptolyngbyaceae cyanobacterium SM1_1_3]|nr:N-acetylmuramoyl-L-alanine amidase [Leptolyngbyaceae cyanobacterium SM1_1_3]NJN04289.1 N-acetylmuramoyl-L-alanine amidase [Leptolyngbyaceae cyanobacterium RM1_1_2]NJO08494.1 N-acetylmuramoyl-L-alanine amidase [Leptolyngbyaceae cyanobacterium SL_1_1]
MRQQLWVWGLSFLVFCIATVGIARSPGFNQLQPIEEITGLPLMEQPAEASLRPTKTAAASQDFQIVPAPAIAQSTPGYQPREEMALADPTNYGDRYATDAYGRSLYNDFIIVIHETVGSARSAINLFQTPHPRDEDQVSYHTLIDRDGTVVYIVPPEKRAFGAGDSVFDGPNGSETVLTNPDFPSSVNNFAYHVSLETPEDGRGNGRTHSGYTQSQYESLAWLVARSDIPDGRITTHRIVDRSGNRIDPRSFDFQRFLSLLHRYPSRS